MNDIKKIIFVHQGKTGGSTLMAMFNNTFSEKNIYHDTDMQLRYGKKKLIRSFETKIENWRKYRSRKNFNVIYGHFSPQKYRRAFPDAVYITFYRHPIQRFLSLYHFWMRPATPNQPIHPYRKKLQSGKLSIEEFAKLFIKKGIGSKKTVAKFKPEYFDFTGITEEYDLSIELLRLKYIPSLPIEATAERVNPDKKITEPYKVNAELHELLSDLLCERINQYDNVADHFKSDCEKAGLLE